MSAWQPIETAPKDEAVLIYAEDAAAGMQYDIAYTSSNDPDGDWYSSLYCGPPIDVPPTHWMPLPEPPEIAKATAP